MKMTMAIEDTGAYLRREAAEKGGASAQAGSLFIHVTRHGNDWALELCDETPIDAVTAGVWDKAVCGDGEAVWHKAAHGRVWRCEWQGDEDPAPAGSKTTWI